jgi:rhamnosyltransferase
LIIDNNSNKNTKSALENIKERNIKIIYNNKNYGIARALNEGVVFAKKNDFKWILTMDQDSVAEDKMVDKLIECARFYANNSRAVSFSPNILYIREGYDNRKKKSNLYQKCLTVITSGNLIKIDVFNEFIKYEEKLFIDSVDFDFCLKLKLHGYNIIKCNNVNLYHRLGEILKYKIFGVNMYFSTHLPLRKYYIMRNNVYILRNYFWKFPFFCLKKQVFTILECFKAFFIEKDKMLNIKFIIKGFFHGIINRYNEIDGGYNK